MSSTLLTYIERLTLPDPNDRHVLAAAVHGKASVINTNNLTNFPNRVLQEHDLRAQAPDDFVKTLLTADPDAVRSAAEAHRMSLKNPPKTVDEYLSTPSHTKAGQYGFSFAPFAASSSPAVSSCTAEDIIMH